MEVGLPAVVRYLPDCVPCLAAGPLGGSHCYGNDDDLSQDHGWGPGFAIWLDDTPYDRFALALQVILDHLPREHLGYGWRLAYGKTCRVYRIGDYTHGLTGRTHAPEKASDWLHIPESALFEITHRPIFLDTPGVVTRHFAAFTRYPDDVWKKRLSACLAWTWRWGVEYLPRMERRGDLVSSAMYWSRFAEQVMRCGFLLNRCYAPYHKWLYREFTKLTELAPQVIPLLEQGFTQTAHKAVVAAHIIEIMTDFLQARNWQPATERDEQPHISVPDQLLYRYARSLQDTIGDPVIRDLDLYAELLTPPTRSAWGYFSHRDAPRQARRDLLETG